MPETLGGVASTLASVPAPATGPLHVAAVVLVLAGLAKLVHPAPTAMALAGAGIGGRDRHARALGALEIIAGSAAVVVGGRATAAGTAVLYAGFAAFTARQVASGDAADCGCFGAGSAPTTRVHVVANAALAALAGWAVVAPVGTVTEVWADGWGTAVALVLLVAVASVGVRALLTDLPAALTAGREAAPATGREAAPATGREAGAGANP